MTMIQERYVSFEVAKLLKEKGFNEPCRSYFIDDTGDYRRCTVEIKYEDCSSEQLLRPTLYMTMEWLREKGIFIAINNDDLDYNWQCYDLINRESTKDPKILSSSYAGYKTYEEAVDAAIKYSLEKLV